MSEQSKPGFFAKIQAKFKRAPSTPGVGSADAAAVSAPKPKSKMSARQKQWVNLAIAAGLFFSAALIVSSLIGGPETDPAVTAAAQKAPDSVPIVVPGEHINDRDRWLGGAGQEVALLRDKLTEQIRANEEMGRRIQTLEQARDKPGQTAQTALTSTPGQPAGMPPGTPGVVQAPAATPAANAATPVTTASQPNAAPTATQQKAVNSPEAFPAQPRGNVEAARRLPVAGASAPGAMPPGTPGSQQIAPSMMDEGPRLVRVSLSDNAKDGKLESDKTRSRHVGTYLPISFAGVRLIGGIAAPTGGQAQSNPLPVFLKVEDNAFLPNHFRARIKDCFVIGAAYGDKSSERAYIRTETLSCVTRSGQSIEAPLKGSIYGEDGMLGVRGTVVTKQGQVLANAAAAGIASGIGQGFSAKYTTFTTTPIGTSETINNDKILQAGMATGFSNALDRLASYWISVAEQMHPVIEIGGNRRLEMVTTKGTVLEFPLDELESKPGTDNRARINRIAMMRGANDDE